MSTVFEEFPELPGELIEAPDPDVVRESADPDRIREFLGVVTTANSHGERPWWTQHDDEGDAPDILVIRGCTTPSPFARLGTEAIRGTHITHEETGEQ